MFYSKTGIVTSYQLNFKNNPQPNPHILAYLGCMLVVLPNGKNRTSLSSRSPKLSKPTNLFSMNYFTLESIDKMLSKSIPSMANNMK